MGWNRRYDAKVPHCVLCKSCQYYIYLDDGSHNAHACDYPNSDSGCAARQDNDGNTAVTLPKCSCFAKKKGESGGKKSSSRKGGKKKTSILCCPCWCFKLLTGNTCSECFCRG